MGPRTTFFHGFTRAEVLFPSGIETEGDTMNVKAYLTEHMSRLRAFGLTVRMHSAELISITMIALIGSFLAGAALQEQTEEGSQLQRLKAFGPEHVQLTGWTAEFFNCPAQSVDSQCRRVFRKDSDGALTVQSETLPLGSGRFATAAHFTEKPTHVRLSHDISTTENSLFKSVSPAEKPVIVLFGQPVCDKVNNCIPQNVIYPLNKISVGSKEWVQFDSQIEPSGRFGPREMAPIAVAHSQAHKLFTVSQKHRRGVFFELGLAVLAPLLAIVLTIWAGSPRIFMAVTTFLAAHALWLLVASDTLTGQKIFLKNFTTNSAFALVAFASGWVLTAAMNMVACVWSNKYLARHIQTTLSASVALLFLIATYFITPASTQAATALRLFEFVMGFSCAAVIGFSLLSIRNSQWSNKLAQFARSTYKPDQNVNWNAQIQGLLFCFIATSVSSLWAIIKIQSDQYVFNWSTLLFPVTLISVVLYARPQLTVSDLQNQKDNVAQQELLVKLLSQLGTFKNRNHAIALVVNFCNRELPRLGFDAPNFLEGSVAAHEREPSELHEVNVIRPVQSTSETFGWIVARAKRRTENTAIGERIIEALSSALAQHLDIIHHTSTIETEAVSAQKFIPRDLIRFFGLTNLSQIEPMHEFGFNGTVVCITLTPDLTKSSDPENLPERGILNELTAIFSKHSADANCYMAVQESLKWTVLFRDTTAEPLRWIESVQLALRTWNQHRTGLGMTAYECTFGVHFSPIKLHFAEQTGTLRHWIQFDNSGVAATLCEVASQYCATVLLSQNYVLMLSSGRGADYLPEGVRPVDRVWNRLRTSTVDVFEFFSGEPDSRRASKQQNVSLFSKGVKLYLAGQFEGAKSIMTRILDSDPYDKGAQRLMGALNQEDELRAA